MEVVIVTSSKDGGGGMAALDVATGSAACPIFKNCIAESGSELMACYLFTFSLLTSFL